MFDCLKINILKILTVVLSSTVSVHALAERLLDAETGTPLPLASISDRHGNVIGMTSREGVIPKLEADCFPITFAYMGYEPVEVALPDGKDVLLRQNLYELPEIVVAPGSRPLLHLTGYMREVSSQLGPTDSITVFRESIVDFLTPVEKTKFKGWSKPRVLASRTFVRISDSSGLDSIGSGVDNEYMLWGDRFSFIPSSKAIPESMKGSGRFATDTVMGKYFPKNIWVKNGSMIRWYADMLADKKGHVYTPWVLKAAGMTSDFKDASFNYVFHKEDGNQLKPTDLTRMSLSIDILLRGKIAKWAYNSSGPLHLRTYIEFYLTDSEYLTETDGKALKKNPPVYKTSEVKAPLNADPPHPGIRRIVERGVALKKHDRK